MNNSENSSPSSKSGLDAFADELGDDTDSKTLEKELNNETPSTSDSNNEEDLLESQDVSVDLENTEEEADTTSKEHLESHLTSSDLDDLDSVTETATLEVYSKKCLECKTLISWATKEYKSCHFTNGNADCPGASVEVVVKIPQAKVDDAANKIITATKNQDTVRLANIYSQLAERSEWVRSKVFERVKEIQNS